MYIKFKTYNESLRDKMVGTPIMNVINDAIKRTNDVCGDMPETLKDYLFSHRCKTHHIDVEIVDGDEYDFEAFGYKYKINK